MEIFSTNDSLYSGLESYCDATLRTEDGHSFPVHRILLATESDYFKALLFDFDLGTQRDHLIPGVSGEALKIVLRYVYTQKCKVIQYWCSGDSGAREKCHVSTDNLGELLMACDYLSVKRLLQTCCDAAVELTRQNNCFEILGVAHVLDHLKLYDASFLYAQRHFGKAMNHVDAGRIQKLPLVVLRQLLSSDRLNVDSEHLVWEAVTRWISHDPKQRRGVASELLSYLRLENADEELIGKILEHPHVLSSESCESLLSAAQREEPGTTTKERLLRAVMELWPQRRLEGRQTPRRFLRGMYHEMRTCEGSYDRVKLYLSFDDRGLGDDNVWFEVGEMYFQPTTAVAIGNTVFMFNTRQAEPGMKLNLLERESMDSSNNVHLPPMNDSFKTGYSVVAIGNSVFCIGGSTTRHTMERYQVGAKVWALDARPPPTQVQIRATVAHGTLVYTIGVGRENDIAVSVAHAYDPQQDVWSPLSRPRLVAGEHSRLFAHKGNVFHFRLKRVERFDIRQDVWVTMKDLPQSSETSSMVVVEGNLIVSFRGSKYSSSQSSSVRWLEETNEWQHHELRDQLGNKELIFCELLDAEANRQLRTVVQEAWKSYPV